MKKKNTEAKLANKQRQGKQTYRGNDEKNTEAKLTSKQRQS